MSITSNFLGLSLKREIFKDLFECLKKYLKENDLEEIIEIQNFSSLHISVYYFGKVITVRNLEKIKIDLIKLNKKENSFPVYIDQFNFFERKDSKHLGYLYPSKDYFLEKVNFILKQHYVSEVADNEYSKYIPHITLFKIKDPKFPQKHIDYIVSIIDKYLKQTKEKDVFQQFNLYSVDSNYSPEKQEVVL